MTHPTRKSLEYGAGTRNKDMTNTIRKCNRMAILGLVAVAAVVTTAAAVRATDTEAWTVYERFIAECEAATSIEPLLPFFPEWRRAQVAAADEAGREETRIRVCKATEDLQDIAFVSAEETDAKTVLHLKASWNDLPMKGRVVVVREDDGLKVDEWSWVTGQ